MINTVFLMSLIFKTSYILHCVIYISNTILSHIHVINNYSLLNVIMYTFYVTYYMCQFNIKLSIVKNIKQNFITDLFAVIRLINVSIDMDCISW